MRTRELIARTCHRFDARGLLSPSPSAVDIAGETLVKRIDTGGDAD
jgi:hypothetical protein